MTREEAAEFLPLIQAYVEGEVIQHREYVETDEMWRWMDVADPDWSDVPWMYRIKSEAEKTNNTEVKNHTIMDTAEKPCGYIKIDMMRNVLFYLAYVKLARKHPFDSKERIVRMANDLVDNLYRQ